MQRSFALFSALLAALTTAACGKKEEAPPPPAPKVAPAQPAAPAAKKEAPAPSSDEDRPRRALALALSQFEGTKPKPARVEILVPKRRGGSEWEVKSFDDPESNVFHKVIPLLSTLEPAQLLTFGGMKAAVKGWRPGAHGFEATTHWTEAFGGKFNRMRDAELGDVDQDNQTDIVVGTHDQGVVAYLHRKPGKTGKWSVTKIDRQPNTFIHEIELGDMDRDGILEIYATPSEPNRLDGGAQAGRVVRYVPKLKQGRKVVADLGNRHAKEILVHDVDNDGPDELYVAVEALTAGDKDHVEIVEPVEIRRYHANTKPSEGKVIARIPDRYCRFLTVGDVDGDGKKELVATGFRSGVWLLRPGADADAPWSVENIDKDSSGFEHAALLADLDEDDRDELYVAADDQGELRRYTFRDGKVTRDTILKRDNPRETWTWNISVLTD